MSGGVGAQHKVGRAVLSVELVEADIRLEAEHHTFSKRGRHVVQLQHRQISGFERNVLPGEVAMDRGARELQRSTEQVTGEFECVSLSVVGVTG